MDNIQEKIKLSSPLGVANNLLEIELNDKQDIEAAIEEINAQFDKKQNSMEAIGVPVFYSIIDGILENTKFGRSARRKGLTASKVIESCKNFKYSDDILKDDMISDTFIEYKNMQGVQVNVPEHGLSEQYERKNYEDTNKMNEYKEIQIQQNASEKKMLDEYTEKKNLYAWQNNKPLNYKDPTNRKQGQTDHIVPLKEIYDTVAQIPFFNKLVTDEDLKNIANQDYNFAFTSAQINQSKKEKTNIEYVKSKWDELESKTKFNMITKDVKARTELTLDISKKLVGERLEGKKAVDQALDYTFGELILAFLKPLWFELKDIFHNGLKAGVKKHSKRSAIAYRITRIIIYMWTYMKNKVKSIVSSIWNFIKLIISSLVEVVINAFIGIIGNFLRIVKEGIKILCKAWNILKNNSGTVNKREKYDALLKMLGASLCSLIGIGIDQILRSYPFPYPTVVSTIVTGIATTVFMYLLDRWDLFNVKREKRMQAIEALFEQRRKMIESAKDTMNTTVIQVLEYQRIEFNKLVGGMDIALEQNDFIQLNNSISLLAAFFKFDLQFSNTREFIEAYDNSEELYLKKAY